VTVYALEQDWDYEGSAIIGVYSDVEKARAAAKAFADKYTDSVTVTEIELDAAAEWPAKVAWRAEKPWYEPMEWKRV